MVPAPVGFHCPACVAEAQRRVPPVRSQLGGVARANPRRVTTALIGINGVLYALTWLSGDAMLREFGLIGVAVAAGEWWRLLTAPFLHAGLWHVGLNMFALWVLGGVLEPLLGRGRFLMVYLASALGGAVASYAFSNPGAVSVGASGAVFGLLGGLVVALRRLNRDVSGVIALLLINVALGFVFPNIDWRAHLGGLVVGALVTAAFAYAPARYRDAAAWATLGVVLLGLAMVVDWRTTQVLSAFF